MGDASVSMAGVVEFHRIGGSVPTSVKVINSEYHANLGPFLPPERGLLRVL